jgi:hypothetical protein
MIIVCVAASVSAIILCQIVSYLLQEQGHYKDHLPPIYDNNNEEVQTAPTFTSATCFYPQPTPLSTGYYRTHIQSSHLRRHYIQLEIVSVICSLGE